VDVPNPVLSWIVLGLPFAAVGGALAAVAMRWARLRRRPAQDPETLLLGAVSSSLRERGELAASLGELRTVHERILDALPVGLLWVDTRHRVAGLNEEGRRLLQVHRGVVGLDAAFVLEPHPWLLEILGREPGNSCNLDGGGRRWKVRRIAAPERVGALVQFEDITEAEAETRRMQLRERFAELGEMTAGVAHQLKNGLAVLKGHAQLLRRGGHEEVGCELQDETESLERVVQRFLQWARPLDPECCHLALEEVVDQAADEVRRRPCAQGRLLERQGSGRAVGDPVLLHQALLNLLENACQASPLGGKVQIEIEAGQIRILDQGRGIAAGKVERMMRPFESGRPDGTGLGLPLALKWLNGQGAELRLEARPEGGTRAEIRW
jgi:signal transduction histidine kinase